jgi:hypothetical protein
MAITSPRRRRRSAEIIVTGIGAGDATASAFLRAELDGVRYVSFERYDDEALEEAFREADMLVFVVGEGEAVDAARTQAVAAAARDRGFLVAALVVEDEEHAAGSPVLAAVREAADMVVIVREPAAITSIVAALR